MWGLEPSQQCEIFFGLIVLQLVGCPPADTGFDFIMVIPLLPFSCVFSFVLGCGVSFFFFFLLGPGVFLSMVVQQLVVIWCSGRRR